MINTYDYYGTFTCLTNYKTIVYLNIILENNKLNSNRNIVYK